MSIRHLALACLSLSLIIASGCKDQERDDDLSEVVDDGGADGSVDSDDASDVIPDTDVDPDTDNDAETLDGDADDAEEVAPDVPDVADTSDAEEVAPDAPDDAETDDGEIGDADDSETDGGPTANCDDYVEKAQICVAEECVAVGFVPRFVDALTDGRQRKIVEAVYTEAGGGYWFVLSQEGIITAISDETGASHIAAELSDRVRSSGGEEGLLSLAFPPDFPDNAEVYLSYTGDEATPGFQRASLLTRMPVNTDDWTFDKDNEQELLRVPQPASNHNGGSLRFGPDNYIYLSIGDGGGANDEFDNGQDKDSLLGVILRLDVLSETTAAEKEYAIPADNPFVGKSGADEIYAYGLRNVWKFSFDANDGRLFAADVGQNKFEEVDIIESGGNYGWSLKEGFDCFDADDPCEAAELGVIDPIWTYNHSVGRSITGGYVYRGVDFPILNGRYLTADYGSGRVWFLTDQEDGTWDETEITNTAFSISGFAENGDKELLVFNYRFSEGPAVYQLSPLPESCE